MNEVVEYQARVSIQPTIEINVALDTERDFDKLELEPLVSPACPVEWRAGEIVNVTITRQGD